MCIAYRDKQPTNDNAVQRHTYSSVHRDIRTSLILSSHNSQPLLLGNRLYAMDPFSAEYCPKGFRWRDESPALYNRQSSTSLTPPMHKCPFSDSPTWLRRVSASSNVGSRFQPFNVYASYPVLQRLLPWCLSRSAFFRGVLWWYGVPRALSASLFSSLCISLSLSLSLPLQPYIPGHCLK